MSIHQQSHPSPVTHDPLTGANRCARISISSALITVQTDRDRSTYPGSKRNRDKEPPVGHGLAEPATLSCLLAEDEALIGIGLEDLFSDIGIQVAGPFSSCADALHWLGCHPPPTFAVLDFTLRDGPCTGLALALIEQGVPLVIYSGYSQEQTETPPELRGVRWIEKPVAEADLLAALIDLVPSLADRLRRLGV